jgi:hypothetical protein
VSDFVLIDGFEDVWRAPVGRRVTPRSVLAASSGSTHSARARLGRIAARVPEVMVKITGRTKDPAHLRAHLEYISRNGDLPLETADGSRIDGRGQVHELAENWAFEARLDARRSDGPMSHSIILSMPAGTDVLAVRDAARAFATQVFAGRHDHVFTLHTDTPRPHVHLSVCSRGHTGQRLNPKKADLDAWRRLFAEALRERGVAAEATPRRARGVIRKGERMAVRKIGDRGGDPPRVTRSALTEAARLALGQDPAPRTWEIRALERQRVVRDLYLRQARLLAASPDPLDRRLAVQVAEFLKGMPPPASRRMELARALRAANKSRDHAATSASPRTGPDRER